MKRGSEDRRLGEKIHESKQKKLHNELSLTNTLHGYTTKTKLHKETTQIKSRAKERTQTDIK